MEILVFTLIILVYFTLETIYRDYFKYKKENAVTVNQIENFLEDQRPQIQALSENVSSDFQCTLCGSRKMDTNVISISGKEYSHISRKRPHKFLKATCMGCGLSQFFNLNQLWGPDGLDPLPLEQPIYQRFMAMADHFPCPHCPHRKAVAKIVTVRRKGVRHTFIPQPSEWICLCCKNCGWSSFFDTQTLVRREKSHAGT